MATVRKRCIDTKIIPFRLLHGTFGRSFAGQASLPNGKAEANTGPRRRRDCVVRRREPAHPLEMPIDGLQP